MFKKLCLATLLAVPAVSMAEGLSYNYVEAGYVTVDVDGGGKNPDGFGVAGSFQFAPMVFGQAGYSMLSSGPIDLNTFAAGLGLRHGVTDTVDLVGGVGALFAKVDVDGLGSDDDTGYYVSAGARALVLPKLEVNGGINYSNVFDDGNTSYSLGGVLSFTPQLALVGGLGFDSDATTFTVGGRFSF